MSELIGKPYIISIDSSAGDGGDKTVDIRPDARTLYVVKWLAYYHDDDVNRDSRWASYDGSTTAYFGATGAVAASAYQHLDMSHILTPLVLTRTHYLRCVVLSLAAPHKVYVRGLVEKIMGVEAAP